MTAGAGEQHVFNDQATRQVRNLLRAVLFVLTITAISFARDLLLPVVLALFIALTFRPAIRYLSKHRIPPLFAAAVFFGLLVGGGITMFYFVSGPIIIWFEEAPQLMQTFSGKFRGILASLETITSLTEKLQDVSTVANAPAAQEVVIRESALPAMVSIVTGYPVQFLITLLTTLVLAVFLMASGDLFYEKLVRILPTLSARKRALHIAYDIENQVSGYVFTLTAINFVMGALVAVIFHLLGMPLPYLWGVLAFLFNYVPYVGALAGIALSGFMAVVTFDTIGYALLIPLAYGACSIVESEILSPHIMGRSLQMNSVAILLSLAFWTWMWGIAGSALALPFLVSIKVFCDHMEGLSGLGEFIASRQVEASAETAGGPSN
jgi:predicted PurR-regulated permease PerM